MIVTASSGKTVNMRSSPSTKSSIICTIPVGTNVSVKQQVNDAWYEIEYKSNIGYMMSKYLVEKLEDNETLSELKTKLKDALLLLDKLEAQK